VLLVPPEATEPLDLEVLTITVLFVNLADAVDVVFHQPVHQDHQDLMVSQAVMANQVAQDTMALQAHQLLPHHQDPAAPLNARQAQLVPQEMLDPKVLQETLELPAKTHKAEVKDHQDRQDHQDQTATQDRTVNQAAQANPDKSTTDRQLPAHQDLLDPKDHQDPQAQEATTALQVNQAVKAHQATTVALAAQDSQEVQARTALLENQAAKDLATTAHPHAQPQATKEQQRSLEIPTSTFMASCFLIFYLYSTKSE